MSLSTKKKGKAREWTDEELNTFYEAKDKAIQHILGELIPLVGHAMISFEAGGAVDMYYYSKAIEGTGFATQELIDPIGNQPIPNRLGVYEFVAFTKENFIPNGMKNRCFEKIERRICKIFTRIGRYSFEAKLEPSETCELPIDEEPNYCLIFDEYKVDGKEFIISDEKFGLLLIIEIHREEMEFAIKEGSAKLLKRLKENGFYPYSDLNRDLVV